MYFTNIWSRIMPSITCPRIRCDLARGPCMHYVPGALGKPSLCLAHCSWMPYSIVCLITNIRHTFFPSALGQPSLCLAQCRLYKISMPANNGVALNRSKSKNHQLPGHFECLYKKLDNKLLVLLFHLISYFEVPCVWCCIYFLVLNLVSLSAKRHRCQL